MFSHHSMSIFTQRLIRRAAVMLTILWAPLSHGVITVDYNGTLIKDRSTTPQTQTFTTLQPGGAISFTPGIDSGDPIRSFASLSSFTALDSTGLSYGTAAIAEGDALSANRMMLTDTVTLDIGFTQYFIEFDILAGSVELTNPVGAAQAGFSFDVQVNGEDVVNIAAGLERDTATGNVLSSTTNTNLLNGFSITSGATTRASWERTRVLGEINLGSPGLLSELLIGTDLQTNAQGDTACTTVACAIASANFDDPPGRWGRVSFRCSAGAACQDEDGGAVGPDLTDILNDRADIQFGVRLDGPGPGGVTVTTPPTPTGNNPPTTTVPEPPVVLMLGFGGAMLWLCRRRRSSIKAAKV